MALGERITDDPDYGIGVGDFSSDNMGGVANVRRRKKSKRHRRAFKKTHRFVRHRRRSRKIHKKSVRKGGKRPYPHWLKKYWFKKKR